MKSGILRQIVVLLAVLATPVTAMANELKSSSNYGMESAVDYLRFKILVADLKGRDDWLTKGEVKAYSEYGRGGTSHTLFNVWTEDQANTEYHRVKGKVEQTGALALWVKTFSSGTQRLSEDLTYIKIEDSDHYYPYAYVDFYWSPVMGGQTWYFYFEGKTDENDGLTYYLGSATCSTYMGRPTMDVGNFKCERKNSRQLTFSIPGTPDEKNYAARDCQVHEGKYEVTFNYHLYSGETKPFKETFTCAVGARTEHDVDIPASVGNFRSLDLIVKASDALKNVGTQTYYYTLTNTYKPVNVLPTVPTPNNIVAEYRQFDAKIELKWDAYVSSGTTIYTYIKESVPYVFRIETDKDGKPVSGQSWKKLGTLAKVNNNKTYTYSDNGGIKTNTYYKYIVANVPETWTKATPADIAPADLNTPADAFSDILNRVGYVETKPISTKPEVTIFDFMQNTDVTDKVKLQWKYTRVPGATGNVTFDVYRSPKDAYNWTKIGTATSKANPDANTVATFEDKDVANEEVRNEYKVQLSFNADNNHAESDVVTAGLLEGTSFKDFTASKGTHDSSVMLQWNVHHVGTDNTNYDIYRRYVGGTAADWMLAATVSGRSDKYTYEDKTVRPGYYYEYKLEAYSGEKATKTTPIAQTSPSIGFCQARGVVSGRISYSTGNMGVEDVRVTLSSDDDDEAVRGYSQRVDGATQGIYWNASDEETAKLFGTDKDFTVQMFVRPDSALKEGAVIAEIPGEGRLVVGKQTNGNYELMLQKMTGYIEPIVPTLPASTKTTDLSTLKGNYEAKHGETLTGKLGGYYKISIADGATVYLKDATIRGVDDDSYAWAAINCLGDATIVLEGSNIIHGFSDYYPGIHIVKGKTLSIKGNGSLTIENSWGVAAHIGGGGHNLDCGNIVIEGGNISMENSGSAVGIGSGNGSCGDITITGGTINISITNAYVPAIGAASEGSCGNITITNTVSNVTAELAKGWRTLDNIGRNDYSSCGTITIGGTVYWNGSNYLNNGATYLKNNPFSYSGDGSWLAKFIIEKEGKPDYCTYGTATATGLTLPSKTYSLLTVSRKGGDLSLQVDDSEVKKLTATKETHIAPFSVGGASDITAEQAFKGNFTEVRVWDHVLTQKEQSSYADRVLSGREKGLGLYWPMDEGLNLYVFDASYSNDVPNGRHATVGTNVSSSVIIPDVEQLSRYGVTNGSGEYTIRGIPFVGSGTSYTFTPTKGIHTFSPKQRNGFISPTSLALNGTDFNDESSFSMSGKVTYKNTNIPVDSVQFKIDGTAAQTKEGLLVSDANGEYEISVPIGSHRIEAWKDGHLLSAFPQEEGQTHEFVKAETVNFTDSTLVNVTGRINGGFSDMDEPVGFGLSTNRIGQATVKLSLGQQSQCSFNYITNDRGESSFGTTPLPVASATTSIASTAWRGAGTENDKTGTYYIYIETDPETGEFSALLPPLRYKVESITFENDEKDDKALYNDLDFFTQNLPVIDATTTNEKEMSYDLRDADDENSERYYYSGKMVRQLRNAPTLTVVQDDMQNGAFGMESLVVDNVDGTSEKVEVTTYEGEGFKYNYDYPLFMQNETYYMTISLSEQYTNVDTKETVTEIPADATIHIANEGSISTAVIAKTCELDGKEVQPGEVYEVSSIEATPDEQGQVHYSWIAGLPNLAGKHLRSLSISARVSGRTYTWKPDGKNAGLNFVALGGIITGTNFVTGGPDHVDMILRRPPGSTAYSTWTVDTIHTKYSSKATFEGHSGGGGVYVSVGPEMSTVNNTLIFGIFNQVSVKLNHTVTRSNITEDTDLIKELNSYTISETKTTPSGDTYTQRDGDTFIGRATNLLFGKGEAINLFKQSDGKYRIDQQETICAGETFSTTFIYPHQYIEDVLLPNWQLLIDGFLTHYDGDLEKAPEVKGKMMYYTHYNKGDAAWGKANSDTEFWTREQINQAKGEPGYHIVNGLEGEARKNATDSVEWCVNQIKMWKAYLALNEEDKIEAFKSSVYFDKNYSIAGGTSVSHTAKNTKESSEGHTVKTSVSVNNETHTGLLFNAVGAYGILQFNDSWGTTLDSLDTDTYNESFTWQISDAQPTTALSVDVYESPHGWGPIFRTRGGQSSQPYEGATYTKYFQPGTQLDEATMRVEKPELRVDGPTEITDVPTGGQAKFKLQLYNASETKSICSYSLKVVDGSNPNGAQLFIDGTPLSNGGTGRSVKMQGGEQIDKQLIVMQSDRSIRDYEDIRLILCSTNDTSTVSTPVALSVHFVPASAHVDMAVSSTVVTKALADDGGITATMSNLDRQDKDLRGLRLRYRLKSTDSWNVYNSWSDKDSLQKLGYEDLKGRSVVKEKVKFDTDGLYELQAQTFGMYGNEEVTYETDIIEILQDTHGPKMLGMASPESGQLTWLNRNNMHIRFNEALNGNALSKSDNFRIEGGLNNVVADGGRPYPDVAVLLTGDSIETEAMYDLTNTDYAFDMWFYRQGDGTIISLGTEDNLLSLSTHDGGKLRARVGGKNDVFETGAELPENKWMYMALNYKRKTGTDAQNRITMLYSTADDDQLTYVGQNMPAKDLDGHGKLSIGGDGMTARVAELSIWNSDVTADDLYLTHTKTRASYTPGLVGYWRMDEGHGTQITDAARSRNMYMPAESWYINNENRAAHLTGEEKSPLRIDIATFQPAETDNFAYEMWFRGTEADNPEKSTLMFVSNGSTKTEAITDSVYGKSPFNPWGDSFWSYYKTIKETTLHTAIGFDKGMLKLMQLEDAKTRKLGYIDNSIRTEQTFTTSAEVKSETTLSEKNYLDGNWHHFALNVRRGTSAIAYVDGQAVKVLPEANVPGIKSRYLTVGGVLTDVEGDLQSPTTDRFKGDVDEIRIWDAALDGQLIADRMYERMDDSYPGLVGYFPMEEIHRTAQANVVTDFSLQNFGEKGSKLKLALSVGGDLQSPTAGDFLSPTEAPTAPALKPGSSNLRLTDKQYGFTASADEIYFSFPDSSLPLMDGNDFVATVSYITDEYGNNSETTQWKFHTDFASLRWNLEEDVIYKMWDEVMDWQMYIGNPTGTAQSYEISGLPTWMTVDKPIGTVTGDGGFVLFHIGTDVPVGRYTEYIYLTDRLGIRRVLQLNLTVMGDQPDWYVDPDRYESNMTLTGQVYIGDKICEYTETMVGAFDEYGNCCGVARPRYVTTRDAYYVDMIVYGASATELSSGERDYTFKLYDASTGITYPVVELTLPDGTTGRTLRYTPDALMGTYDAPVQFRSTDNVLQTASLSRGWTWMSLYVQPASTAIKDVLPKDPWDLMAYQNIKSKTAFASVPADGSDVKGSLTDLVPGNMYKIQVSSPTTLDIYGKAIDVTQQAQTIHKGYNWIGSLSGSILSPDEAFADLQPAVGDMVKSRRAYAMFGSRGTWEGMLESIVPGEGYVYQSKAEGTKTFHYPRTASVAASRRNSALSSIEGDYQSPNPSHFVPVDDSRFPDNMAIIAVVMRDGQPVEDAEVAAFINGECRGAVAFKNGYYFLTVMGSSADDRDATIELRVWHDGQEYVIENEKRFVSDAAYGTLDEPYVLTLDAEAVGITVVDGFAIDNDDSDWYTLQGFKIGRRPTQPGVYIHRGEKVTIKKQ